MFTLLRQGRLGVAVGPIQLDAAGRTNLSGIGPPGRPKTAMIGPPGLPENNDTPSPLWYLLPAHSPRTLVGRVDMICGPAPSGRGLRALLTPAGRFELRDGGWRATWLAPGGEELVAGCPDFPIAVAPGTPVRESASATTIEALTGPTRRAPAAASSAKLVHRSVGPVRCPTTGSAFVGRTQGGPIVVLSGRPRTQPRTASRRRERAKTCGTVH